MNKEQIKFFLSQHPGYTKEGKKRLKNLLVAKGYDDVSEEDCAEALREVRSTKGPVKNENLKVLIYDIETSYNIVSSWRIGHNITLPHYSIIKERAIICVSYKWLGEDEVHHLVWDRNQCDKSLLEMFIPVLNEADLIVAHNGDRFDIKWIKTRALKHGLSMYVNYPQFDTIKVAKKKFYFNSNKLDYISEFLGFGKKIKTEPELWDRVILEKDKQALKEMVEYCDMDVILLEKVYKALVGWEYPKVHSGALNSNDKVASPFTGEYNIEMVKKSATAKGTVKWIMKCNDTNRQFELSDTLYKKYLKQKDEEVVNSN